MSETAELIQGDVFTSLTYERSSSIAKLTQALVKAQVAMRPAKKSSENPYFKSNYADLSAVWEVAQQPIADNGLAVLQPISSTPDGRIIHVTTILSHVSGEWISSVLALTPKAENQSVSPQAAGSAITYGRRYALQSMLGIVSEDDDGEGAEGRGKPISDAQAKPAPTYQRPPVAQVDAPMPDEPPAWTPEQHNARQKQLTEQQQQPAETPRANPANADKPISDAQAKRLFAIAKQHGWENDELREFVATCGYEHSKDILRKDYDGIIEVIIGRQRDRV
jgi:hypothetical protein